MSLSEIKFFSAILTLIVAVIAAWLPFHQRLQTTTGHEFPRGEALACGVFLGAGLIHMLGSAAHRFDQLGFNYPFAFLICGVSFLSLLLLEHFGTEIQAHGQKNSTSIVIVAFLLLSIHSLFAGAALGLSKGFATTILILIAIIAHKWAASFSLAVQINKSSMRVSAGVIYFAIFAVMAPLGILLGNSISQLAQHNLAEPVFASIAAGTFLYIGTLHGLKRAVMIDRCCNLKDFIFVIVGFVLMAVVAIWT